MTRSRYILEPLIKLDTTSSDLCVTKEKETLTMHLTTVSTFWTACLIGLMMARGSSANCPNNCTCNTIPNYFSSDELTGEVACQSLPNDVPYGTSQLTLTELNGNVLFADPLQDFSNVEVFNFNNLGIITINSTVTASNLRNLKVLRMAQNRLRRLNGTTFTWCPFLVELVLNDNDIKTIDDGTFTGLRFLERLNLANNKLTQLQFRLPQPLVGLDVSNNHLQEALNAGNFQKLVELNLCGNDYETFSTGTLVSPQLSTLCLGDMVTSIVPNSLSQFRNLTSLTVVGKQRLNGTARQEFHSLPRLLNLTLSYLNFPMVSNQLLAGFPSLQELHLFEIESASGFEMGALKSMANLTLLDMRRSPKLVDSLLLMMNNEHAHRTDGMHPTDWKLKYLDISENHLECNTNMQELLGAILDGRIQLLNTDETVCAAPPEVTGRKLVDFQSVKQILGTSQRLEQSSNSTSNSTEPAPEGIYYYLDQWGITTDVLLYIILGLAIFCLLLLMALLIVAHYKCRQRGAYKPQNDGSDESFMMRADSEYTFDNFTLSETMAECHRTPTSTLNRNRKVSQK